MLQKQDIKPPVPCRPCRLYKLQLDFFKLIYIKEEKHPYTYTRLQITGIYFDKQQFVFSYNTFILFQGIHSYITSMIHCTDSYKLMSITFWKHCRFSSISLKTRTVRAWSADDGFSDYTGKNNGFPFLDIFGYLKNTHKNPKFGRVRQVPIWELGWEFPGWDLSHFAKFGIFMGIL